MEPGSGQLAFMREGRFCLSEGVDLRAKELARLKLPNAAVVDFRGQHIVAESAG